MTSYIGAGVLPVCYNPHADVRSWYYFLGQEAYGQDEDTWSDFGGRPKDGETPIHTAAREAYEELRGSLGTAEEVEKLLMSDKTTCIRVPKRGGKDYFLYIYKCPLRKMECVTAKNLSSSKPCQCLTCAFSEKIDGQIEIDFKEKKKVGWVKADYVYKAIMDRTQTINLDDGNIRLRNAFCFALGKTPEYKKYERFQRTYALVDKMFAESDIAS